MWKGDRTESEGMRARGQLDWVRNACGREAVGLKVEGIEADKSLVASTSKGARFLIDGWQGQLHGLCLLSSTT